MFRTYLHLKLVVHGHCLKSLLDKGCILCNKMFTLMYSLYVVSRDYLVCHYEKDRKTHTHARTHTHTRTHTHQPPGIILLFLMCPLHLILPLNDRCLFLLIFQIKKKMLKERSQLFRLNILNYVPRQWNYRADFCSGQGTYIYIYIQ